jgi:List-Bact-rpt repeat protein
MSARHGLNRARSRRVAVAMFLAALLALALTGPAQAVEEGEEEPNHPFNRMLLGGFVPLTKPAVPQLEDPCGVTVGSVGEIYVSDYRRRAVRGPSFVAEKAIQFPTAFKTNPDNGSCGLAIDDEGNLYVNYWHGSVVRYEPNIYPPPGPGEPPLVYATEVIDPGPATGVTVDPNSGDLYINKRTSVAKYSFPAHSGDVPLVIGAGTLKDGYGVAFSSTDGEIFVADAADNTVKVYDPGTSLVNPVRVIDGAGTPQEGFVSLVDSSLAVNQSQDTVFVVDNLQPGFEHPLAAVDEFNISGLYRGRLEQPVVEGEQRPLVHGEPLGIAVDESRGISKTEVIVTSGNGTSKVIPEDKGPPVSELSALWSFGLPGQAQKLGVTRSGAGQGSVKSSPAGIACPGACEAEFNKFAAVTLTPTPAQGSVFAGWSGACSGTGSCVVTMGEDATVDAQFAIAPATSALGAARKAAAVETPSVASSGASLSLGKPHARGAGTVALKATVPGPGTLSASGRGLKQALAGFDQAGSVTLRLHLNRAGRRALAKSKPGRLSMRLAVSFKPSDGAPGSFVGKTLTFKQTK